MPQIFTPKANTWIRVLILALPVLAVGVFALGYGLTWSGYETGVSQVKKQPIPFSHRHHVGELGLDCRYCHASVATSAFADLPPAHTCMSCHSQIWNQAEMLAPLRESFRTGKPLAWVRVHDLPGFVYFHHGIHLAKGVGCTECHGRVDKMSLTFKTRSLYMKWCLDCHRDPGPHLRPPDEVFNPRWRPTGDPLLQGKKWMEYYRIAPARSLTDCVVCHR